MYNNIKKLYNLHDSQASLGYTEAELVELEARLKVKLPTELRNYYLLLGKNKQINYSHNKLLKPDGEIGFAKDQSLMFYAENQHSVYWGIKEKDFGLDNPPVWGDSGSFDEPNWHLEAKTTKTFLLQMAIFNGIAGGLKYHANCLNLVESEVVKKIKTNWNEIAEISWEMQKSYTDDFNEVINLSFDEAERCTGIFIGTSHKDRFDNLLEELDVDWSYVSYEDE